MLFLFILDELKQCRNLNTQLVILSGAVMEPALQMDWDTTVNVIMDRPIYST